MHFLTPVLSVLLLPLATPPALAKEACPEKVRVAFYNFAVSSLLNGNGDTFSDQPGLAPAWVHEAIKRSGCTPMVQTARLPQKRMNAEISENRVDLLALAAPTEERMRVAQFPMRDGLPDPRFAMAQTRMGFWVRRDKKSIQWDGKTLNGPPRFRVAVTRGSVAEEVLTTRGIAAETGGTGIQTTYMLLKRHVQVAALPELVVDGLPEDERSQLELLLPVLQDFSFYAAAGNAFYAQYLEFTQRFWRELCRVSHAEPTLPKQRLLPACPK